MWGGGGGGGGRGRGGVAGSEVRGRYLLSMILPHFFHSLSFAFICPLFDSCFSFVCCFSPFSLLLLLLLLLLSVLRSLAAFIALFCFFKFICTINPHVDGTSIA